MPHLVIVYGISVSFLGVYFGPLHHTDEAVPTDVQVDG